MSQRCRKLRERATRRCSWQVGVPAITLTTHAKSGRRFARALLFLLGGGAVARVPSLVASCAPLLSSLCAPRASFLSSFRSPASPFLTPLRAGLRGIRGRCRWRGGVGVVWASAFDPVRTADEATSPNAAAYPNKARAFRRQTPLGSELSSIFVFPQVSGVECLALDPAQPDRAGRGGPEGSANAMQKNWRSRASAYRLPQGLVTSETSLYRPAPTRLTPPFALPPAL